MRALRSVLVAAAAGLAVGSVTITTAPMAEVATASGRPHPALPSAHFIREARTALVRFLSHHHPEVMLTHPGRVRRVEGITQASSVNWSGYADTAKRRGAFTRVSARWVTPRVKCTREDRITSEWVGLDGFGTATVEQAGTIGWCFQARPIYFTWFEMFPNPEAEIGTALRPGDKIRAMVSRKGPVYKLSVVDATHKSASFHRTARCKASICFNESAEWIAERSSFQNAGVAPLVNYTRWAVSAASVTANGHIGGIGSVKSVQQLVMMDATGHYALSRPSALRNHGHGFVTRWHNSW